MNNCPADSHGRNNPEHFSTHFLLTSEGFVLKQGKQCTYNITLRCGRVTIVVAEKQYVLRILSVGVSVCLALVIQHEKRVRRSIHVLSSVACPSLQYFSTLSQKRRDFRK